MTFQVRDAGILLAAAVRRLAPGVAARFPTGVIVKVGRIKGGVDGFMLALAEASQRAGAAKWIAFAAGILLGLAAVLVSGSRRAAIVRLGVAAAGVGGAVALAAAVLPALAAAQVGERDRAAARAVAGVWLDPLRPWALAAAAIGGGGGAGRRLGRAADRRHGGGAARLGRGHGAAAQLASAAGCAIAAVVCAGAAMVAWPRAVLTAAVAALGVVLLLAASPSCSRWRAATRGRSVRESAACPVRGWSAARSSSSRRARSRWRRVAGSGDPSAPKVGRCNGHAALCDRRLDEVAMLGTHNAMAAADEPGWLFAAQDAGIPQQLEDGVRACMIDTHYGVGTARGVATELSGETKTRGKLVGEVGERFVAAAERAAHAHRAQPDGRRQIFLCHAFCEVGATRRARRAARRCIASSSGTPRRSWCCRSRTTRAPRTRRRSSATAAWPTRSTSVTPTPPWPTLRELIDRDERVIVLAENHAGGEPWIHQQPRSCRRRRSASGRRGARGARRAAGPTAAAPPARCCWSTTGSTPRRPRASRSPARVNAHDFLDAPPGAVPRGAACSRTWSPSTSTARATRGRSSTSSTASGSSQVGRAPPGGGGLLEGRDRRSSASSPPWRPTSCSPTGRPSGVNPPGARSRGAGHVMREHERIHSR